MKVDFDKKYYERYEYNEKIEKEIEDQEASERAFKKDVLHIIILGILAMIFSIVIVFAVDFLIKHECSVINFNPVKLFGTMFFTAFFISSVKKLFEFIKRG